MGMLLTYRPGYFPGDALEDDDKRAEVAESGARRETPGADAGNAGERADGLDDLTDDELATAYAERVGGNASTRRGYLKALRKAEASADAPTGDESEGEQPDPENAPDASTDESQPEPENDPEDVDESDPEGE